MMGRRGNQADSRGRMTGIGNPGIHLAARKMSALSRLCALRHLYLNLFRAHQITAGHAKPSGSHLLDRRTAVTVQTFDFFPTFSAVGLAVETVHCNS